MRITNALVYGENQKFEPKDVYVKDGKFVADEDTQEVLDAKGCYLIPGLVDVHFHGCVGADLCDGDMDGIKKMADYELSVGVTSICPATMTISEEELKHVMTCAGNYQEDSGARFVGINMEGPFISEAKKGAQAAEHIKKCDVSFFRELQTCANGKIKLVDIACEEEGAMEFIDAVKDEVAVSLAHTVADYDQAMEAFQKGARHVTHLYNAMPPFTHRNPGVIGAAIDTKNCKVELICDGIHIHPSVIRATFALFGPERMILISDSMRATGLEDGLYTLGGQEVFVQGNKATLADGTIAGSVTNLMDCMRYAVKDAKIPLETAVAAATINPAKEIGMDKMIGSISEGKFADFILLDQELHLKAVYKEGKKIN